MTGEKTKKYDTGEFGDEWVYRNDEPPIEKVFNVDFKEGIVTCDDFRVELAPQSHKTKIYMNGQLLEGCFRLEIDCNVKSHQATEVRISGYPNRLKLSDKEVL